MQEFSPVHTLSELRLSVLYLCEQKSLWDSKVLSETGQSMLEFVFPRTALLSAVSHSTKLAQVLHDEKTTKAENEFHLFRLPMYLESAIHREFIARSSTGYSHNLWGELEELPTTKGEKSGGPISLGELDLKDPKALSRIGHSYKSSLEEGLLCIPFFTLNR